MWNKHKPAEEDIHQINAEHTHTHTHWQGNNGKRKPISCHFERKKKKGDKLRSQGFSVKEPEFMGQRMLNYNGQCRRVRDGTIRKELAEERCDSACLLASATTKARR